MISASGYDEFSTNISDKVSNIKGWATTRWFSYPWTCILRYPNESIRKEIASLARRAANNDLIGEDPWHRMTYWTFLIKAKYDPAKIKAKCEADCSSGIIANVRAVGHTFKIRALENIEASCVGNMKDSFERAGFLVLDDKKFLISNKYIKEGDILLCEGEYCATNLSDGSAVTSDTVEKDMKENKNPLNIKIKQHRRLYHTTLKGDSLDSIAESYNVSVKKLQVLNGITHSHVLVPGKRIRVK